MPRDRWKALAAVHATGGAFVKVPDSAILAAIAEQARSCGVFAEPAGAAPLAGLRVARAEGLVQPKESVVLIATGNGLKAPDAAIGSIGKSSQSPIRSAPGRLPAIDSIIPPDLPWETSLK